MRKATVFVCFVSIASFCSASLQVDPFYLQAFERAREAFLTKDYPSAIRDFEIAVFGLSKDKKLNAEACIYLGLSYYYQKNMKACETNLRNAARLMGDEGFDGLNIQDEARPDLDMLSGYFNIRPKGDKAPAQDIENSKEARPGADKNNKASPAQKPVADPRQTQELKINEIKEGDIVPLELVDYPPLVIKSVEPVYPNWARSAGIKGTVVVNALISEKGKVIKTKILQGIKDAFGLDQAAARAARQWEFDPATIKGKKVKVWMPISIEFGKKD